MQDVRILRDKVCIEVRRIDKRWSATQQMDFLWNLQY